MIKKLGVLLLIFIAAVGLSTAASAQATYNNNEPSSLNYNNGHG
jgi:hypothetical protein